ncbi:MAG: aldehyde dehydrogenase family protein [Bacteroidetes bacterium]|nr:aldehyde dehydrogenase family protein [Bacteroidota bacterium]
MNHKIPTLTPKYKKEILSSFSKIKENSILLRASSASERITKLKKLKSVISSNLPQIEEALKNDLNKSITETNLTEVLPTLLELRHTIKNLREWVKPHFVPKSFLTLTGTGQIIYEPKGTVLIISPWNYPFQLAFIPLLSAIAAGNSAIIRPSDISVNTTLCIKKIIEESFNQNEVEVILGDAKVSEYLTTLPFDHIFFTGSPSVGKKVMANASKNLTSVTLELGGKSPAIIHKSANLKDAANKIAWGKLLNLGQTCIAPDYVIIQEGKKEKFISYLKKSFEKMLLNESEKIVKIISKNHFERIKNITEASVKMGAKIIYGGKFNLKDKRVEPTIMTDVNLEMPIMKEEIFGPILPIVTTQNTKESISFVNKQPKPLALYIFSNDRNKTETILKNTSSGGTCVNDVMMQFGTEHLPFGGVNNSGVGSYHGYFGFKTFSHERSIFVQGKIDVKKYLYPPYTKQKEKLTKFIINKF